MSYPTQFELYEAYLRYHYMLSLLMESKDKCPSGRVSGFYGQLYLKQRKETWLMFRSLPSVGKRGIWLNLGLHPKRPLAFTLE